MSTPKPTTFLEVLDLWPRDKLLAEDIGLTPNQVYIWRRRGGIPDRHWDAVAQAALKFHGIELTRTDFYIIEAGQRVAAARSELAAAEAELMYWTRRQANALQTEPAASADTQLRTEDAA